eukprot:scaffold22293_cov43-Phaeocystis_antarctica.AAC.1
MAAAGMALKEATAAGKGVEEAQAALVAAKEAKVTLNAAGSTPRPAPRWRPHFGDFGVRAPRSYNTTFRYNLFLSTVLARLRRARTVLSSHHGGSWPTPLHDAWLLAHGS